MSPSRPYPSIEGSGIDAGSAARLE
jgi:hypothetical protein